FRSRPQHQMIGVAEHDIGAGIAHLAPMHALHGPRRADRHEGRRPHRAMRRGQPAGAGRAVCSNQLKMIGSVYAAAYDVTVASCSTSFVAFSGEVEAGSREENASNRKRGCIFSPKAVDGGLSLPHKTAPRMRPPTHP